MRNVSSFQLVKASPIISLLLGRFNIITECRIHKSGYFYVSLEVTAAIFSSPHFLSLQREPASPTSVRVTFTRHHSERLEAVSIILPEATETGFMVHK